MRADRASEPFSTSRLDALPLDVTYAEERAAVLLGAGEVGRR